MADVELVIKIPESKLWSLKNEPIKENFNIYELASYIDKGTQLPKGHGRLIDADALGEELHRYTEAPYQYALKVFNDAPTILEADKAESEE